MKPKVSSGAFNILLLKEMNPNTAQSLDPKLKEAYDRVMGTQLNTQPSLQPVHPQTTAPQEAIPVSKPQPTQAPQQEMVNINTATAPSPQNQTVEKKSKLKPVIFVVAGVVFFLIYTVIWLKFFSVI